MSFFRVTVETVEKVWPHSNADRLELASLQNMSFQFCVQKGLWKSGDKCLYFPVDSLLPDKTAELLGVKGLLAGKEKNRIKTIRLRGEYSQGIIGPCDLVPEAIDYEQLTEYFGVVKYEPPVTEEKSARLFPLPAFVPTYDIEGADRYKLAADEMMDLPIAITEKLEGMCSSISWNPATAKIHLCSHRKDVVPKEDGSSHFFWTTATRIGLFDKLRKLVELLQKDGLAFQDSTVSIFGEFCGPRAQGNIYGLPKHDIYCFDIRIGEQWLDFPLWKDYCLKVGLTTVPILWDGRGTLREVLEASKVDSIPKLSDGESVLRKNTRREGIVIRPVIEQRSEILHGRLQLKQRSPAYLAKSEN